jgi:hypothetical protein
MIGACFGCFSSGRDDAGGRRIGDTRSANSDAIAPVAADSAGGPTAGTVLQATAAHENSEDVSRSAQATDSQNASITVSQAPTVQWERQLTFAPGSRGMLQRAASSLLQADADFYSAHSGSSLEQNAELSRDQLSALGIPPLASGMYALPESYSAAGSLQLFTGAWPPLMATPFAPCSQHGMHGGAHVSSETLQVAGSSVAPERPEALIVLRVMVSTSTATGIAAAALLALSPHPNVVNILAARTLQLQAHHLRGLPAATSTTSSSAGKRQGSSVSHGQGHVDQSEDASSYSMRRSASAELPRPPSTGAGRALSGNLADIGEEPSTPLTSSPRSTSGGSPAASVTGAAKTAGQHSSGTTGGGGASSGVTMSGGDPWVKQLLKELGALPGQYLTEAITEVRLSKHTVASCVACHSFNTICWPAPGAWASLTRAKCPSLKGDHECGLLCAHPG